MPKVKISEYSATANSNTDVASINIDEGCAPSGINNAIRAVMGHLKDFQQGTYGDPFNGPVNGTVGATTPSTGAFTTLSSTGNSYFATSSGSVGIGTSSPGYKLDVSTSGTTTIRSISTANGDIGRLIVASKTSGAVDVVGVFASEGNASDVAIGTTSNHPIVFLANNGEKMRLDASGNLLVGATTAYAKLKVGLTSSATTPIVNVGSFGAGGVISLGSVANNSEQVYLGTGDTNGGGIAAGIGFMREASGWNSALSFYTNNVTSGPNGVSAITERMRLDSSGNLLVGTTSASFGEKLSVQSTSSGTNIAYLNYTYTDDRANTVIQHSRATGATSAQMVLFRNASSSQVGLISSTGSATTYGTSSDYRLKENVQPMVGALSKVAALNPVTYTWKADGSASEGFIAHELQAIVPDAVVGEKDAVNEDGSIKPQSIDTSFLVATLTAAIKEQQAIIQSLTARITALESA